jgi:hypothetical protein
MESCFNICAVLKLWPYVVAEPYGLSIPFPTPNRQQTDYPSALRILQPNLHL